MSRPLACFGEVHPPGSWGRIMNGGAWLSLDGTKVDVLLRDLDVAMYWSGRAQLGRVRGRRAAGLPRGSPDVQPHGGARTEPRRAGPSARDAGSSRMRCRESVDAAGRPRRLQPHATRGCAPSVATSPAPSGRPPRPSSRRLTSSRAVVGSGCSTRRGWWSRPDYKICMLGSPGVPTSPPELVAWVDGLRAAIGRALRSRLRDTRIGAPTPRRPLRPRPAPSPPRGRADARRPGTRHGPGFPR